jgi:hypothetical protein
MTDTDVTRVLTADEALTWLTERSPITAPVASLAEAWGWSRQSVYRILDRWVREGAIERRGNTIAVVTSATLEGEVVESRPDMGVRQAVTAPAPTVAISLAVSQQNASINSDVRDVRAESGQERTVVLQPRTSRHRVDPLAVTVVLSALVLAGIGMVVNARFAASFGQTADASVLLAGLGLVVDVLAFVLLTVGCRLWVHGRHLAAMASWAVWAATVTSTLLATSGWSATNIGDAIAGRVVQVDRQESTQERLHRLRQERAAVTELRTTPEIDAALAAAQGVAGRAWDRTVHCTEIDRGDLGSCRRVVDLRQARARADHRDRLDEQIAELERAQTAVAIISAGDPGAALVASLVGTDEFVVRRLRVTLLTILPACAGILLSLAAALQGAHRCAA